MDEIQKVRGVWDWFPGFWHYEITAIDGAAITVSTLVTGILLFAVGYVAIRRINRMIDQRVLSRLDVDMSLRAAFSSAIYYILLIMLTLTVLRVLHVPLTVFTVLGGALAIGVGFGSQNIVNNFFSGLIIVIGRPVKIGDLIEVDNVSGTVEEVGVRSTIVRSANNTQFVVPNSMLLEKPILNWTYANTEVRGIIKVGVAYGSNTQTVKKLLLEAAERHDQVLRSPPPTVIFEDFGDNALIFELFFWVQLNPSNSLKAIAGDIRFSIDELCRQNGVNMPFPQRDVHLDSARPIEVKVLNS
jgi:potassium efflux system protein